MVRKIKKEFLKNSAEAISFSLARATLDLASHLYCFHNISDIRDQEMRESLEECRFLVNLTAARLDEIAPKEESMDLFFQLIHDAIEYYGDNPEAIYKVFDSIIDLSELELLKQKIKDAKLVIIE